MEFRLFHYILLNKIVIFLMTIVIETLFIWEKETSDCQDAEAFLFPCINLSHDKIDFPETFPWMYIA